MDTGHGTEVEDDDEQEFPGHLLHQAALWDNEELLFDLLKGEGKGWINSQDSWGRTPLHAAATTEHSKCLDILLAAGADPNQRSGAQDNFKSPLHTSAEHGYLSNVTRLVEGGADIHQVEGQGLSALELAQRGGHGPTAAYLVQLLNKQEERRAGFHLALREACSGATPNLPLVRRTLKDIQSSMTSADAAAVINQTPNGTNSILFKACECGNLNLVKILIEAGALGRIHPVTKYSPLYIAAYYGHKDIVILLLNTFPLLVQVPTVEKWLPLHAACINGHAAILEVLLKTEYAPSLLQSYPAPGHPGLHFKMAFDLNMKDVSGQTALYIACQMGNPRLVDALLRHRVVGLGAEGQGSEVKSQGSPSVSAPSTSPTKKVIAEGIQGILSKLSLATNQELLPYGGGPKKKENLICPVDVNAICEEYQTALHVAVKQRHHVIAASLLAARADPNLPILPTPSSAVSGPYIAVSQEGRRPDSCTASTALLEACLTRDLGMIDLLLKHGARDDEGRALLAVRRDDVIVGKILALHAHLDSEHRVNTGFLRTRGAGSVSGGVGSAILPTVPVTINWHAQNLDRVTEQWLIGAALKLNPRLRLCPRNQGVGLQAITRLDLSSNALEQLPLTIWTLASLVTLNLSQNKLTGLEFPPLVTTPFLEEILLQENRLSTCPSELFTHFPGLKALNLSNNKLGGLPPAMWAAGSLHELNVSLNLLKTLPSLTEEGGVSLDASMFESLPYFLPQVTQATPLSPDSPTGGHAQLPSTLSPREALLFIQSARSTSTQPSTSMTRPAKWRAGLKIVQDGGVDDPGRQERGQGGSSLTSLNLSHNSFLKVPKVLACLGSSLQRLNLSYNSLRVMGHVGDYPSSLRQLDLSHNGITRWFYPPPPEGATFGGMCHAGIGEPGDSEDPPTCPHRLHPRLEHLKTLLLSGNQLTSVCVGADVDPGPRLWYPNLTMLDLSENTLTELPARLAELSALSVLNLSGNAGLTELPPEMGLLSRMWNLNLSACPNLAEPLRSMLTAQRCKTMDVIGYLKSVLEDARPYCRMKLMVVGGTGIGKTSLLAALRQEGGAGGGRAAAHAFQEQDHWARRMSGGAGPRHHSGGGKRKSTISTVGVDIGTWVQEVKGKGQGFGPVLFRTWDFGGQREYYATHLYFLSKRSLYLVVWNICDGEKGLNEMNQWLVNIQARAPNSPVIIVGTHYDLVAEKFPPGYLDYLQQRIRDKLIWISDPEKRGLPRVMHSVEISCKTRHNLRHLSHLIYETVFGLKTSSGKTLLEQKIPSKYIHLEHIVAHMANERKAMGQDPVLTESEFKDQSMTLLEKGFGLTFRDDAEMAQACSFLHENGILLHYEDSTLRDLYFLDPQWLCDMLAHVVTIREINPFAKGGVMRVSDLSQLFKGRSAGTRDYVLSLLSKFELAVAWDESHLLIPSLLPTHEQMRSGQGEAKVSIPVRSRALRDRAHRRRSTHSTQSGKHKSTGSQRSCDMASAEVIAGHDDPRGSAISRFILISYFPSGFWPRLISRVLADDRIVDIVRSYWVVPDLVTPEVGQLLDGRAEWSCWQAGMELTFGQLTLLRVKEVTGEKPFAFMLRRDDSALCETDVSEDVLLANYVSEPEEQVWDVVDLAESGLLEIQLPEQRLAFNGATGSGSEVILVTPSRENVSKLLALVVDHVDTLLEDWYPSIGTRFIHTSEGKYLVTRLIPCPRCFPNEEGGPPPHLAPPMPMTPSVTLAEDCGNPQHSRSPPTTPRMSSDSGVGPSPRGTLEGGAAGDEGPPLPRTRAGIAFESPKFSGSSSCTSGLNYFLKAESRIRPLTRNMYSWSVEYCILETQRWAVRSRAGPASGVCADVNDLTVKCPKHGPIPLRAIAPDVLFLDLAPSNLLRSFQITHSRLLGRGAFGFVFGGNLAGVGGAEVAVKMFQPVDPGPGNPEAELAYKVAQSKWLRAPAQSAARAYVAARGEVRVLSWVVHPHVVPFLGLCQSPLAIVMPKAPRGALDAVIADFRRSGDKIGEETVREALLQVGRALEYLHAHHIIYRDLKAENVLAWRFPPPFAALGLGMEVDVKLADYGISRSSFPTGSKGFGGTEGFMAPEIIRYNGEEEYTDKVDIFSFGMLLFEMMSLRQPFEGCENVKESILEGDRPRMQQRDCGLYSMYMLDLMTACWAPAPKDRPSATSIVNVLSSPDVTLLRDVVGLGGVSNVVAAVGLQLGSEREIWLSCSTGGIYALKISATAPEFSGCVRFEFVEGVVTAVAVVEGGVWMGDTLGKLHVFAISDYSRLMERDLEGQVDGGDGGSVGAVVALEFVDPFVGVATSSGRLFLVRKETGDLITELGRSTLIHCLAVRTTAAETGMELWAGEKAGQMSIFKMEGGHVTGEEGINHYDVGSPPDAVQVLLLESQAGGEAVFSYVYPGSVIYGWAGERREMISRLDVGRLSPVKDSVDATEEGLMAKPLQVTVLHCTADQVFVGTNWGFVILADAKNLYPLTLLRPFAADVRSFWIFPDSAPNPSALDSGGEEAELQEGGRPASATSSCDGGVKGQLVIGIGKGFSSLLDEGKRMEAGTVGRRRAFAILWSVGEGRNWL